MLTFFRKIFIFLLLFLVIDFFISKIILNGIFKYYGFGGESTVLINGSSMSMTGFDRSAIESATNYKIALYAREGVNVEERHVMLQHYFSEHPKATKTVIYEVNPLLLSNTATAENVYTLFYPFSDNEFINDYINKHETGIYKLIHKVIKCSRFDVQIIMTSVRGFLGDYQIYKTNTVDSLTLSYLRAQRNQTLISINDKKIQIFDSSMQLIKKNGANAVLVVMPMVNEKKLSFIDKSYNVYYNFFKNYAETANIEFVDFNIPTISTDATLFSDPLHLNNKGQKRLTEMLNELLLSTSIEHSSK